MDTEQATVPLQLSTREARVLGCLMEKALITPEAYPLTVNSLTLACNQKSNREPLMSLSLGEVGHLVGELAERQLVRVEYGGRANRIWHRLDRVLALNRKQQAVLALLLLREPQTLNEVRVRTERMAEFAGPEEVLGVLRELRDRDPPLALCFPKGQGRREDRYTHTLCGVTVLEPPPARSAPLPAVTAETDRLLALEARVEALEQQVAVLLERLGEA